MTRTHLSDSFFVNGEFGNVVSVVNHKSQSKRGLPYLVCGAGNFGKFWSTCEQLEVEYTNCRSNKVKAIPLQAWTGPEGSVKLRLPDFKTVGT